MKVKCYKFEEGDEFPHELKNAHVIHTEVFDTSKVSPAPVLFVWVAEHEKYGHDHAD